LRASCHQQDEKGDNNAMTSGRVKLVAGNKDKLIKGFKRLQGE